MKSRPIAAIAVLAGMFAAMFSALSGTEATASPMYLPSSFSEQPPAPPGETPPPGEKPTDPGVPPAPEPEEVPPGIIRIGGPLELEADLSIAVFDTGVKPQDDLNVLPGVNCTKDGNTEPGYNDENGHGTHMAGIIGAKRNGKNVVGGLPGVAIVPVQVISPNAPTTEAELICGFRWIKDNHRKVTPPIKVVNVSLGGLILPTGLADDGNCGRTIGDEIHTLVCEIIGEGVAIVVAAGNDTTDASVATPAGYEVVLTVSAFADTDGKPGGFGPDPTIEIPAGMPLDPDFKLPRFYRDDTFAFFSNFGDVVDVAAPGVNIKSLTPEGGTAKMDGTSQAAPHAAVVVGWLFSKNMDASVEEIFATLKANVETDPLPRDLPGFMPSGFDLLHDEGLVQARDTIPAPVEDANNEDVKV